MGVLNISMAFRFPPDSLLSTGTKKNDVEDWMQTLLIPADNASVLIKAEELNTMISGEDDSSSVLNGRLRPRKSTATLLNPPNKPYHRYENKVTQDKPKRNNTPSKASPNKQDDLTAKADSPASPLAHLLCPYCDRTFTTKVAASKHARRIHLSTSKQDSFISCLFCNHSAAESNEIIQHMVDSHSNQYFACLDCHTRFTSSSELAAHKLNVCEKQTQAYRSKLRQKTSLSKKDQKKGNPEDNSQYPKDSEETKLEPEFNGLVISCELKPSQGNEEVDIEDKITTNLILPSNKTLANSVLEKNAVIILDDIQWKKRIPPNFSFHNADADQILSRLGVVHRSPRVGESSRREWLKMIDDSNQKFEKCFDTNFYARVASNVQENLARFVDGTFNFSPDPDKVIKTRKSKSTAIINTAEGFPILLPHEQYSRNSFDGYMPRAIAPKHKWKWDSTENEKHIIIDTNVMKRDNHVNQCIITLVSSLDIWTQLRMRRKFEEIFCKAPTEKMEKQNIIGRELKEILESREIPCSSSEEVEHTSKSEVIVNNTSDFPSFLGLSASSCAQMEPAPAVLSGEWVRPRCYVCCACGDQTRDSRALSAHMSSQHPNAQVQHYDVVGESLLDADILKHLYVPPSQMSNRTRPLRGFRDCTKCKKSITLEDLHQHMLDCAGDTPTVRRKVRSRPFGVRRRRPRLSDSNNIRKKIRKEIRTRHNQKALLRARPRKRTEVGDAETIRKMLADLPAKRHRQAAGHPTHHVLRPRRKIEKQRSKLKLKRLASDDTNTRKARPKYDTDNPSQLDEDDQPLKPSVKLAPEKTTPTKKRFSSRLSKNVKILPTDNTTTTIDENEQNASGSGSAAQSQQLSNLNSSHRLNVNRGTNDRGEEGNNEISKKYKSDDHAEEPVEGNQNDSMADIFQLKHSINSITASSNSLQQPQQNPVTLQGNAGETKQNILDNNTTSSKPDKPPLSTSQKRCSKKIQRPLHLKLQSLSNCIEKIAKSKKQTKEDTMYQAESLFKPTPLPMPKPAVVCSSRDVSDTAINMTPANIPSYLDALPPLSAEQIRIIELDRYYRRCSETEMPPRVGNAQVMFSDPEFTAPRQKAPSRGRRRKSSVTPSPLLYDYANVNLTSKLLSQPHQNIYTLFPNLDPHSYLRAMEQNIRQLGAEGMAIPELLQLQYREIQDIVKYSNSHSIPPLNIGFSAPRPYNAEMLYEDTRATLARYNMEVAPQLMFNAAQVTPIPPIPVAPMLRAKPALVSQMNNNYSAPSMVPTEMSSLYALNIAATQRAAQQRACESSEVDVSRTGFNNPNEALAQYYSEHRLNPDMRRKSCETAAHRYKPFSNQESYTSLSNTYQERKTQKEFDQRMNDFVTLSHDNYVKYLEKGTLQDQVDGSLGNITHTAPHSVQDHRSITHFKEKSHDAQHEFAPNAFEVSQRIIATSNLNKTIIESQLRKNISSLPPTFSTTTMPTKIFSSASRNQIKNCDPLAAVDSTYRLPDCEQNDQEDLIDPGDSEVIEQPLDLSGKSFLLSCNENVHTPSADGNKEMDISVLDSHESSDETFISLDSSNQIREFMAEKSNENVPGIRQPFNKELTAVQISSYEKTQKTQELVSTDFSSKDNEKHAKTNLFSKDRIGNIPSKGNDNKEYAQIDLSSMNRIDDLPSINNDYEQNTTCLNEKNVVDAVPAPQNIHNAKHAEQNITYPNLTSVVDAVSMPQYKNNERHAEQNLTCPIETNVVDAVPTPQDNDNEEHGKQNITFPNETNVVDAVPTPQNNDNDEHTKQNIAGPKRINNMCTWTTEPMSKVYPDMNKDIKHAVNTTNSEKNINSKDSQRRDYSTDNESVSIEDKSAYAREILSILFNHDSDIERKMVTLPKELVELLYIVPRDQILKYLRVIPSYLEHIMTENTPLMNGQDVTRTMKIIVSKLFEFLRQLYDEENTSLTTMQEHRDLKNTVIISAALKILAFLEQLVMTKNDDTNTPVISVEDLKNVTQPIEELFSAKILSFLRKLILIKKYAVHTPLIKVSTIESNKMPVYDAVVANINENRLSVNTLPSSSILPKKRHSPSAINSHEAYSMTQSTSPLNKQSQPSTAITSMDDITIINNVIPGHPDPIDCDSKQNISKIIDLTDDDYPDQAITSIGQELVPKVQVVTKFASDKTASLRAVRIKSPWSRKSISDDKQTSGQHSIHIQKGVTQTPDSNLNTFNSSIDIEDSNLNQNTNIVDQCFDPLSETHQKNTQIRKRMPRFRSPNLKKSLEVKVTGLTISDDHKRNDRTEKTITSAIEQNNIMQPMWNEKEVVIITNNDSSKIPRHNSFKVLNASTSDHLDVDGANNNLHESRSISPRSMRTIENNTTINTSMLTNTGSCNVPATYENYQKIQIERKNNSEKNIIKKSKIDDGQRYICEGKQPKTTFPEDDSDDDISLAVIVKQKHKEHAAAAIETKVTKSNNKKEMAKLIKKQKRIKKKSNKTYKNVSTEANLDLMTINVTLNNIVNKEEPLVVDLHNVEVKNSQSHSKSLKNNDDNIVKDTNDTTIRDENIVSDISNTPKELDNEYDIYINYENKINKNINITQENDKTFSECDLHKKITGRFDYDSEKNKNDYCARAITENAFPETKNSSLSIKSQTSQYQGNSYKSRKNKKTMVTDISVKLRATEETIKSQSSKNPDSIQNTSTLLCEPGCVNDKISYNTTQNVSAEHEFPLCDKLTPSEGKHHLNSSEQVEIVEPFLSSDLSDDFKEPNKRALRRRSKRETSMISDDSIEDSSLNENIQKTPFTKKQLIFSKYLLDENNHNESDTNLPTSHDDESTSTLGKEEQLQQPLESNKRKKSFSVKIRSKNNKSATTLDDMETNSNFEFSKSTVEIDEYGENGESKNGNPDANCMPTENDRSLEIEDEDKIYVQFTTKEKRKFNTGTINDTSDSNKAKRIKTNINDKMLKANAPKIKTKDKINTISNSGTGSTMTNEDLVKKDNNACELIKSLNSSVNNVEANSDTQDHNDNENHNEKATFCSEIKTACYNRPIISKQMGLPAALPDKNPKNYDPYDINLEVMSETSQPVLKRKGAKFSNNKASKITKKCSTEVSSDVILKQLPLDEPAQQTVESLPPYISDSESSVSDVPLQKYVEEKEKMKSIEIPDTPGKDFERQEPAIQRMSDPNDTNGMRTKNIDSHINYAHDGQIHSSDTSIKKPSEVTDNHGHNNHGQNISYASHQYPNLNDDAETDTCMVKTEIKQKKNRRSLANEKPESVSTESDQQLSSDKFMESFGFYSVRKPRKSNLLASKKISETFHMIESDDVFFSPKSRQRKSSHSENRKVPDTDCASKTTQDNTTTINENVIGTENIGILTQQIEVEESIPVDEPINYEDEVDLATAQKILNSDEIRRLENELIVGFKEAAEANAGKTSGFNYLRAEEPISRDHITENISITAAKDALDEAVASPECTKKPIKNKHKAPRPPEYKEMMYPDEEVNIYEDKYDIIKRRRTQAAAAKQLQNVDEPRTITKAKKKAERKSSHKKCPKKPVYQVSQVPTKGALKGFDGIKISIPTQDLNMPSNVSPPHNQQRHGRSHKKRKNRQKSKDRKVSGSSSKSESDTIKIDGGPSKRDIYEFEDDERPVPQSYGVARVFDKCKNPSSDIKEKDQEIEVANRSKQYAKEQMRCSNIDHNDKMEPPKEKIVKRKGKGKRKCNEDHNITDETFTEQGKRIRKDDKEMVKLSYGLKPEKKEKLSHEYNRTNLDDSDIDDHILPDTTNFLYRDDESSYETDSSAPAPLIGRNFDGACPCPCTCTSPTEIDSDDNDEIEQAGSADSVRYNPDSGAKSLVMGIIFKNNAVRCDKNEDPPPDPLSPLPKPDLDLLFDSLLEQQTHNTTNSTNKPISPVPGPSSSNKYNSEIEDEKDVSNVDDGFSSPNHNEINKSSKNNKYGREDATSRHTKKIKRSAGDVYHFVKSTDLKDKDIKKSKKHVRTEESDKKHGTSYNPTKKNRVHLPDNIKKCKSHSKHKDKYLHDLHGSASEGTQSKRSRSDVEYSNDDDLKIVKFKKNRKSGKKHKSHHKRNKGDEKKQEEYNSSDDTPTPKAKHRPRSNNQEHNEELVEEKETNGKRPTSRKSDEGISTSHDNSADAYDLALPEDSGVAVQRARRKCTVGKQNVLAEHWSSSESEASVPHSTDSTMSGRRRKGRKHSAAKKSSRVSKKRHSDERASTSRAGPQPKSRARPTARDPDCDSDVEVERDKKKQEQHGWIVGVSHKKLVTLLVTSKRRQGEEERK